MIKNKKILRLVLAAMFLAIGLILPFFTGQIKQIGNMLLPMHLPVLLCGLVCGWQYGMCIGFILPILRSTLFSMPVFFPTGIAMAFELAAYGFLAGYLYSHAKWHCIKSLYRCLIAAMLGGRGIWGIAMAIIMRLGNNRNFTLAAFWTGAFLNAIPGIILQLFIIPAIMLALDKTHLMPFTHHKSGVNHNAAE